MSTLKLDSVDWSIIFQLGLYPLNIKVESRLEIAFLGSVSIERACCSFTQFPAAANIMHFTWRRTQVYRACALCMEVCLSQEVCFNFTLCNFSAAYIFQLCGIHFSLFPITISTFCIYFLSNIHIF